MRIKNKHTGKIVEWENPLQYKLGREYHSIKEFVEEWEDYEEPKKHYWVIDDDGVLICRTVGDFACEWACKQIGNYFETKEEAEKAVEKLKAWRRLENARFKFGTIKYNLIETSSSTIAYDGTVTIEGMAYKDFVDDLDLLFGGENEVKK